MRTEDIKTYLKNLADSHQLKEFADFSGISYSTLQKIRFGTYPNIKLATAEKIEDARKAYFEGLLTKDQKLAQAH